MSLKTYDRQIISGDPQPWPFDVIGSCPDPNCGDHVLKPGEWVTHKIHGGTGMVIAINDEQLCILWSQEPFRQFSSIAMPLVRRVFNPQVAQQLVSVQPMTLPSAGVFYMDYTYGSDLDRKCTQGPLWSRLYWRTRRWLRKIRPSLSSLGSWVHSRFGKRLSSGEVARTDPNPARSLVTPDQTKAIVDEWVNRNAAKARGPGIQGR